MYSILKQEAARVACVWKQELGQSQINWVSFENQKNKIK
jgi:hypothetical protein